MSAPATEAPTTNPFVGPHALSEHDELFGRTLEVRMLRDLVIAERIVLLYSPSGAGKTSLLHAGLKRELIADGFAVLPTVRVTHEATDALGDTTVRNRYSLSTLLSLEAGRDQEMDPTALATITLDQYLEQTRESRADGGQDCLFFDQFEELFTADPIDVDAKREFLAELGEALRNRSRWAIISMREDFAAHLDPYLKLFPTRLRATFRLDLLGPQAARAAIQGPMSAAGVTFDDAAATALVDDLRTVQVQRGSERVDEPGLTVEPVQLQVVCRRLWSLLNGATAITTEHMSELGDVDHALRDFYDEVVGEVVAATGVRERVLRAWVSDELITEQGYRDQVQYGPPDDTRGAVLPALEDAHLVRADRRRNTVWYELAHDRLVDPIRHSNDVWLDEHLSDLQRGARTWEDQRRNDRALFVGADLQAAEAWATEHPEEVGESEEEFLAACHDEQERIEKDARTRRRTRILAIAMTAVAILAVAALVFSFVQWRSVEDQKDRAEAVEASSAYFFGAQSRELDYDIRPRLLLDAMALETLPDDAAPSAHVVRGINTDRFEGYLALSSQSDPVSEAIGATAMSADGSTLAVTTPDGVRVIDLDGAEPDRIVPVALGEEMLPAGEALALDSDGSTLAFVPPDGGIVQLWDIAAGTEQDLEAAAFIQPYTLTLSFAGDDDELLVGLSQPTVTVWDVDSATEVTPSSLSVPDALGLVISPSGALVATDGDGVVHINDLATGEERAAFEISGDVVAVDQAASRLIVTDYETFRVVDTVTGARTEQPPIPYAQVVAFAADGDVLTIDATCVVRRWTSSSEQPVAESAVPGCRDDPFRATVGSDGDRMMVEGFGVGPWWTVVSLSEEAVLESSAVPEGTVAAGGDVVARIQDGRVVIGSPDGGGQAASIPEGPYQQVAVDAGGRAVVAAADDRLVVVDPESGEAVAAAELPWIPSSIAIGGGGTVVAASSELGDVVRWQVARDGRVEVLDAPGDSPIDGVAALAVTGRSGAVVVANHDRVIVHTERGPSVLASGIGEVTDLATAGTNDALVVVASAIGPTTGRDTVTAAVHVWPDGRVPSRVGILELPNRPEAIAVSSRHVMVASGITSDVYNLRAVVSNEVRETAVPELEGGHNDLSSYYGLPGLEVADLAIDETGATPRFLWVPANGSAFTIHLDEAALLEDLRAMAEANDFAPLSDSECVAAAGIPCR